ncbi:MAG: RpiR family transcriptional regulator [Micrococcales bacterium 32-70-13]|nr:MAG: RpiR family transcriptional regulator [Micrococcales bacterium 32-70-13]
MDGDLTAGTASVSVRIRSAMPTLRPSEQPIARLFLDEPESAASLSIVDIAQRCGTSTTSVVRFYKRLGYRRLTDLRLDLAEQTAHERASVSGFAVVSGDIDQSDSLADVVTKVARNETLSISDTASNLDLARLQEAVFAIVGARRIDAFGVGASAFVGQDLQQKLSRIGRVALAWTDAHSAWTSAATLDNECVAVAISHSGTTIDTVEYLEVARQRGAKTIALTNFESSPLTAHADIVLTTAARETRFRSAALGSRIAQLMVIDCLFTGVAQSSYEPSMEALRNTYEVVQSRSSHRRNSA